jgi:hypothetical protein
MPSFAAFFPAERVLDVPKYRQSDFVWMTAVPHCGSPWESEKKDRGIC